jgi:tRNA(His) 5'-end guanylyltransferase
MYGLESRMKNNYEKRFKQYLPRRTNIIIRLDGKAFHTLTKGLNTPYDNNLMNSLDYAAWHLCQNVQNVKLAYVQSDEVSLLLQDYDNINTEAWFDNEIQKMASVSASICTAYFNQKFKLENFGCFDARVFQIPDFTEVHNYFVWRQKDAVRNSIMQVAQCYFSHKQLYKLNINEVQEKLWQEKGINWNNYDAQFKRGRMLHKAKVGDRSKWVRVAAPTLTKYPNYIEIISQPDNNAFLEYSEKILENIFS